MLGEKNVNTHLLLFSVVCEKQKSIRVEGMMMEKAPASTETGLTGSLPRIRTAFLDRVNQYAYRYSCHKTVSQKGSIHENDL
jgi:hypothetical protein